MSTWFLDILPSTKNLIVILASESPRRLDLLKQIGIIPIVEVSGYDEQMDNIQVSAAEFVKDCSMNKAKMVAERLKRENRYFDIIIGCDTVIDFNGAIIGKPKSDEDAFETLKRFRGNKHNVLTGMTLINSEMNIDSSVTETLVEFSHISDTVLRNYIELGEHRGCAGSYRIQGRASAFIKRIEGCYHNVVGLPINALIQRMKQMLEKE